MEKIDAVEYFKDADEVFQYALKFQQDRLKNTPKGIEAWSEADKAADEVAAGHLNLARLYRDMGLFKETEQHLIELIKIRKEHGDREEKIAARRELAEFYRSQDRLEEVEPAYNNLIASQADTISIEDYAKFGTDIANSHNELADVYRTLAEENRSLVSLAPRASAAVKQNKNRAAQDKTRKAEYAFGAAIAIQRFSTRSRRGWVRVSKRTTEMIWQTRWPPRTSGLASWIARRRYTNMRAISERGAQAGAAHPLEELHNLTKLYLLYKDRAKQEEHLKQAEHYNKLLIDVLEDYPRSSQYADALLQLGSIYSLDPNRYSESEPYFNQALKIYEGKHAWMNENIVLFRLSKLYEKQGRVTEREQALKKRVDTLAGYFNQLANPTGPQPKDPTLLVSEYIYAVNALGFFYDKTNAKAEAAAAYHRAFLASDYITRNIYNEPFLKFYAAVLGDYQTLLKKLDNKAEAAAVAKRVDELTKAIQSQLATLRQSEEIARKQSSQQIQQSPTQQMAP